MNVIINDKEYELSHKFKQLVNIEKETGQSITRLAMRVFDGDAPIDAVLAVIFNAIDDDSLTREEVEGYILQEGVGELIPVYTQYLQIAFVGSKRKDSSKKK